MHARTEIRDAVGRLLAYRVPDDWPDGLCACSNESDYLQLLTWQYDAGQQLHAHMHLPAPRSVTHTQGVIVVLSGSLRADVFDKDRQPAAQVTLSAGQAMVFLRGGHGYEILEDRTRVLEITNGPYPGASADRERIEV